MEILEKGNFDPGSSMSPTTQTKVFNQTKVKLTTFKWLTVAKEDIPKLIGPHGYHLAEWELEIGREPIQSPKTLKTPRFPLHGI